MGQHTSALKTLAYLTTALLHCSAYLRYVDQYNYIIFSELFQKIRVAFCGSDRGLGLFQDGDGDALTDVER